MSKKKTESSTCNSIHSHKLHNINPLYTCFTTNIHFGSRPTVPPAVSQPSPARQGSIGLALSRETVSLLVDGGHASDETDGTSRKLCRRQARPICAALHRCSVHLTGLRSTVSEPPANWSYARDPARTMTRIMPSAY